MRKRMANEDSAEDNDDDVLLRNKGSPRAAARTGSSNGRLLAYCACGLIAVGLIAKGLSREWTDASELRAVTWNIAAINNNPFEYWITHEDAAYNKLMEDVQGFIDAPAARDVAVSTVFTPVMFGELKALMAARGWTGLDEVERIVI